MSVTTITRAPARADSSQAGVLAGSLAVIAWGIGPLFVRATEVSTATTVAYRFIIAAPLMHLVAWLFGGRVTGRVMRMSIVPGALFGASLILGFGAVNNTSVSNETDTRGGTSSELHGARRVDRRSTFRRVRTA